MERGANKKTHADDGGKRLTQEERLAIPGLYVALGSKQQVADKLGCDVRTVTHWLNSLVGEQWDHLIDDQRRELMVRSVEIVYKCLEIIPNKVTGSASLRDLVGAFKVIADRVACWGGPGSEAVKGEKGEEGYTRLLAAAEAERKQRAIEEAVRTGSVDGLRTFMGGSDG